MDDGKFGGAALVACALAGLTRNTGIQASAPAAAAPATKARRDGLPDRSAGAVGWADLAGRRSWRGCIGSPQTWARATLSARLRTGPDGEAVGNQALAWSGSVAQDRDPAADGQY